MASPTKQSGQAATKEVSTRKNFDKRTIRKMYSAPFESAITRESGRRSEGGDQAVLQYSAQDVQVYCRKRPINDKELAAREFDVLSVGPEGAPMVHDCRMHPDLQHAFLSNHCFPVPCFDENTTTEELCRDVQLDELFELAANGGHSTVCMFGQTGSGKTFTMSGILQHAAAFLFHGEVAITGGRRCGSSASDGTQVRVACFEVSGKFCFDLLKSGEKLQVREDASGNVQVSAATVEVKSGHALLEVLNFAAGQRITCSTLKNTDSSRSHAFYRLYMEPRGKGARQQRCGSITFVDLAGSERSGDSTYHSKEQIKQTADINTSLSALKRHHNRYTLLRLQDCVRVRSQMMRTSNRSLRVPYRSSPLTMLLRDSFETESLATSTASSARSAKAPRRDTRSNPSDAAPGNRARTVVVVTVAPGASDTEHTLNTLRNACMMAGLEPNAASESRTEVPLVDHDAHQQRFKTQIKHPSKWTKEEVADWFNSACNGVFQRKGGVVPPELDGKLLMRMPEARFRLLLSGDASCGTQLYKALKAEKARANTAKSKAAEALRMAKQELGKS